MRSGSLRALPVILALALPTFTSRPALADPTDAVARATARKLGAEALKLYDSGAYAAALEKLNTANQVVPTPTLGLYAARCLVKLNRLVEASERYLAVSRMEVDRAALPVVRKAVATAVAEREQLLPKIPTLDVEVDGPRGDALAIVVDGQPFLPGLLGEKRPVDPGHHTATARRQDTEITAQADVVAGDSAVLRLVLPALPAPAPPPVQRMTRARVAGWISLGVGAAGAVVGAVSGGIAVAESQALSSNRGCVNHTCGPAEAGTVSAFHVAGAMTTAGLIVGVVGVGLGVPLLVVTPKSETAGPSGATAPRPSGQGILEPWLGLGSAGVRGTF